jgi:hypothetical protein
LRFYDVSRALFLCWRKPGDDWITGDELGIPVPPPRRTHCARHLLVNYAWLVNPSYNVYFWTFALLVTLTGLTINLATRTRKFGPDVGALERVCMVYSLSVGSSLWKYKGL